VEGNVKKQIISMTAAFLLFGSIAYAGDAAVARATAQAGAVAVSNPASTSVLKLNQSSSVSEGTGRWFIPPTQPYSPPLFPYLGPFNSGANILEDLRVFPEVLSMEQARRMYQGGVEVRVNAFEKVPYQFDTCRLMHTLPMRYTRIAILTLHGDKTASTADVIAKAAIEAMNMGATGIYLIKKVPISGSASSGWGIGMGGVAGQMGGQGQTNAQTGSFGTGYNTAQAKPVFEETMAVLAIQE
jgi:hypothetical protein